MTTNYYCPRNCGTILSTKTQRHTCKPQPGDPEPTTTAVPWRPGPNGTYVTESEVEELRRKCAHYHAQRVEAGERIAALEDALRYAIRLLEDRRPDGDRVDEFLPKAKELLP